MVFDRFKHTSIPNTVVFSLTELGKTESEKYMGTPKDRVLNALDEHGASNITQIANNSGLRRTSVESIIKILRRGGYVHSVKGEE